MQARQRGARGGGYILQGAPHAAADIEQQQQIERLRFAAEIGDLLPLVLVEHGKVLLCKIADRASGACRHRDIDLHQRDAASEDRNLVILLLGEQARAK